MRNFGVKNALRRAVGAPAEFSVVAALAIDGEVGLCPQMIDHYLIGFRETEKLCRL